MTVYFLKAKTRFFSNMYHFSSEGDYISIDFDSQNAFLFNKEGKLTMELDYQLATELVWGYDSPYSENVLKVMEA